MAIQTIDEILQKVQSLPPLPAAVERLCAMANDPETDIREMSRVISMDQALTARILRVANSAFYGLSRRVSTVTQAIMIVGFMGIRNLALSVTLLDFMDRVDRDSPLDGEQFWKHTLAVASLARLLALRLRLRNQEEAFTAGLLHDFGEIILMENFPEQYAKLLKRVEAGGGPLHVLEKEEFGIDHAMVGWELCKYWKIPELLAKVIANHHSSPEQGISGTMEDAIDRIVRISDNLARISRIGSDGDPLVEVGFLDSLGVEKNMHTHAQHVLNVLPEEMAKLEEFFGLSQTDMEAIRCEKQNAPEIAVLLTDTREKEIISLTLLALGVTLVPAEGLKEDALHIAGLIGDDSMPERTKLLLEGRGIPLLVYPAWREKNLDPDPELVNIRNLHRWLQEELSPTCPELP